MSSATWFKLTTSFVSHPKVIGLSDKAFRLHIAALAYSAENLTDGEIDRAALRLLGSYSGLQRPVLQAKELVTARLWEISPLENEGYRIHDYSEHQRTKQDVERDRAAARERVRRHRNGVTKPVTPPLRNGEVTLQRSVDLYKEKALDLRVEAARATIPTSQVVSKIEAYVRTVAINYPDERILREDLEDRFKQASKNDVEQGIQLWRQLTSTEANTDAGAAAS